MTELSHITPTPEQAQQIEAMMHLGSAGKTT